MSAILQVLLRLERGANPFDAVEAPRLNCSIEGRVSLEATRMRDSVLGVDCHTMSATGPPVGPDPGRMRPEVCIGDGDGACPRPWAESLVDCFRRVIAGEVTLGRPFSGGYITRWHGREMPWVQIELSRGPFLDNERKGAGVLAVLPAWVAESGLVD